MIEIPLISNAERSRKAEIVNDEWERDFLKEITVDAIIENIDIVTDLVNEELEAFRCPLKFQVQIDVAIDELFGNIARYAYKDGTGKATVRLEIEDDPACAVLTFVDQGIPFDPLDMPEPDTTLSLKERKIGGLGIFLVKKTMDDMTYQYKDGQNILRIKKKLR
jgi:anti-sigma regulatory factor (Ser/Thr protein kinase)